MIAAGTLIGVGVGPGDPELVTVKGVRVLATADVVFVPVAPGGDEGYAERVVLAHTDAERVQRLVFALSNDAEARNRSWDDAGAAVAEVVRTGKTAAFATIGDPNLYSTFTYLAHTVRALVPAVAIKTIPGITALQDLAARSSTVIAEGTQTVALLPFTAGADKLAAALNAHDTVITYKGGRFLPEVRRVITDAGRLGDAVFGARLGLDGEQVGPVPAEAAPYLSTVIVTRPGQVRGGAL